jgi:PIN domain nuclease of toxin-antitoxin system
LSWNTHTLLWWVNGDSQLSQHALEVIEHELKADDGEILVSAISAWKIALLVEKERLTLSMAQTTGWIQLRRSKGSALSPSTLPR